MKAQNWCPRPALVVAVLRVVGTLTGLEVRLRLHVGHLLSLNRAQNRLEIAHRQNRFLIG